MSVGQGLPTFSGALLMGGRLFWTGKWQASSSPGLRGRASGLSPHFQASLWGLPALATPPVLCCWNTEEGWQGSSCTSQAGRNARGLGQGWARGQPARLSSWGDPEAKG